MSSEGIAPVTTLVALFVMQLLLSVVSIAPAELLTDGPHVRKTDCTAFKRDAVIVELTGRVICVSMAGKFESGV